MAAPAPSKDLLNDIQKGAKLEHTDKAAGDASLNQAKLLSALSKDHTSELKHVDAPKETISSTQAKVLLSVTNPEATKHLKKVSTSGEGLTDAQKQAYIEDKKTKTSSS